jgi:hypothetical protein
MNDKKYWHLLAFALLLQAVPALTQNENETLKTDWLEQTEGYKGESMGAELREIEEDNTGGGRLITLAIPKTAITHPDAIEEIVVVGRKPEEPEPLLNIRTEWLDDYDRDNYGLLIHLGKDSKWPLRIYMSAEGGYLR